MVFVLIRNLLCAAMEQNLTKQSTNVALHSSQAVHSGAPQRMVNVSLTLALYVTAASTIKTPVPASASCKYPIVLTPHNCKATNVSIMKDPCAGRKTLCALSTHLTILFDAVPKGWVGMAVFAGPGPSTIPAPMDNLQSKVGVIAISPRSLSVQRVIHCRTTGVFGDRSQSVPRVPIVIEIVSLQQPRNARLALRLLEASVCSKKRPNARQTPDWKGIFA